MGAALSSWSSVPGSVHAVGDVSWMYLSGLPSPDLNMALVHGSDPRDLQDMVNRVDELDTPTLLFCNADGLALDERLGNDRSHVGAMPFMTAEIASTPQCPDDRVRRATAEGTDAVLELWTNASGIRPELFDQLLDAQLTEPDADMGAWQLETRGRRCLNRDDQSRRGCPHAGASRRRNGLAAAVTGGRCWPTRWLARRPTESGSDCWVRPRR